MPADILVLEFLHPDTIVFPKKEEHPVNPAITQYENEEMDTLEDLEPDDACILGKNSFFIFVYYSPAIPAKAFILPE